MMEDRIVKNLQARLSDVERRMVEVKVGIVSDTSPLKVQLDGVVTELEVHGSVAGLSLAVDDEVYVVRWDSDMLVIGEKA